MLSGQISIFKMGFDEFLFGKISNFYRSKRDNKLQKLEQTVSLEVMKSRLTLIARALTKEEIEIFPAEREGGFKNHNFFLPHLFFAFPEKYKNEQFYIFRILYLCIQKKLNLNASPSEQLSDVDAKKKAEWAAPLVLDRLAIEFPTFFSFYHELMAHIETQKDPKKKFDQTYVYGKFMSPLVDQNLLNPSNKNFENNFKNSPNSTVNTIIKAQNRIESIQSLNVDKKQKEDATIYHDLEKLRTADEFNGNWKDFDGDDELQKHQEALKELRMQFTVRVDDEVHSVLQSEFVENTQIAEVESDASQNVFYSYNEWDYSQRQYKKDYCKIVPLNPPISHPTYYAKTIVENQATLNSLRKKLVSLNNKFKQQNLRRQGDDFDLDAVTDFSVSIMSGHTPSENIYIDKQKLEKDLSILLLIDNSLSSDSYVINNKVIEVEKQVSILFGEILNEFQVDFALTAFHSKTRNHINFITLKDFDENWHTAKHKIGSLEPQGYTRIGAPLRHASTLLQKRGTQNRWVVLLSDGKPNDYDRYEGKYGVNDVKQALREMKSEGIQTYALAIEKQAKYYLPTMFGHNHFQILSSPVELLQALIKLYERIRHKN